MTFLLRELDRHSPEKSPGNEVGTGSGNGSGNGSCSDSGGRSGSCNGTGSGSGSGTRQKKTLFSGNFTKRLMTGKCRVHRSFTCFCKRAENSVFTIG